MADRSFPDAKGHFDFGRNWASFAIRITDEQIAEAQKGLSSLLQTDSLAGNSFLDVGSGSGLHSLAALRLQADMVIALDVDENSVATTKAVLDKHAPTGSKYEVRRDSILNPTLSASRQFDIVYSWGVLHHTGRMHDAICRAAGFVKPGGLLVVALYRKTAFCSFWKVEKYLYSKGPKFFRTAVRTAYIAAFRLAFLLRGRSFKDYLATYSRKRGMDFFHDAHDWLGGWPYESATPQEVREIMRRLGFLEVRSNIQDQKIGLFGSGCNEYVFKRADGGSDAS